MRNRLQKIHQILPSGRAGKRLTGLLVLISFLFTSVCHAATDNGRLRAIHLGYTNGLSSQRVFSILQDYTGAMWISTKAGVDRYNGREVKNYSLGGSLRYSDYAGRCIRLCFDESGKLWAYDNIGHVYQYSEAVGSFVNRFNLMDEIRSLSTLNKAAFDGEGNLWLSTQDGIYRRDKSEHVRKILTSAGLNDLITVGNTVFAGTERGVYQLSSSGKIVKLVSHARYAQSLCYDKRSRRLWTGTFNGELVVTSLSTGREQNIPLTELAEGKPVRAITPYIQGKILVGVDGGGVITVDGATLKAVPFITAAGDGNISLTGNGIYAVTVDRSSDVWIGSFTGGVTALLPRRHAEVERFVHDAEDAGTLSNNNVNAICENGNRLWVGTDNGINLQSGQKAWKHSLENVVAISICKSKDGGVWVGTYGNGLYHLSSSAAVTEHLTTAGGQLTANSVFAVYEDSDGDLWTGCLDGRLVLIRKDGSRRYFPVMTAMSIRPVDADRVAVAGTDGFYIISKSRGIERHGFSAAELRGKNVCVYCVDIWIGGKSTLWLATEGGGMVEYNLRTKKYKMYTTADGLPSNEVTRIIGDRYGRLWISTRNGLALMNRGVIKSLGYVDGLDNEYNKTAGAILADGRLAFGGTTGLVVFSPSALAANNYKAELRFTNIETVTAADEDTEELYTRLNEMLAEGDVTIDFWHRTFDINFEAINYGYQHDIGYQYMLEGYDQCWSEPGVQGKACYNRVPPGKYLFKVRCVSLSDRRILSEKTLIVHIGRPWWSSLPAWIIYILVAAGLTCFAFKYKEDKLRREYDEEKIRFFTNTAHDIRTPVTLIMTPLEELSREKSLSQDGRTFLNIARNNVRKLYDLVNRLLDFEKLDNTADLTLVPVNVSDSVREKAAGFDILCRKKDITLDVELPDADIFTMTDKPAIEAILDNLISNACKYTRSGGHVRVSLSVEKEKLIITVADNGIGISAEAKRHIFTDVYRGENALRMKEVGSGFGLLQVRRLVGKLGGDITYVSAEGKGTTFTVTLPFSTPVTDTEEEKNPAGDKADSLLVVEDNDELRYYLAKTLSKDYNVKTAADGEEALEYLKDNYPDLILSDVMMPGIQGDELCRRVKQNPDTAGIPVILLTAKVSREAIVEGISMGADDYIPKPFSTDILKVKIRGMIDNRKRMRDLYMRQALQRASHSVNADDKAAATVQVSNTAQPQKPEEDTGSENAADKEFVDKATHIILEHLSDSDFNINGLCRDMCMSRSLFYSRLKSVTGKAPQEFIRLIRLEKAAGLLKSGMKVSDAAMQTGFVNAKYFSVLFKKAYGIEPSKFAEVVDN